MYIILSLRTLLSIFSEINTDGRIERIPPKARSPIFPPPARANKALESDKTRLALRFSKVAEITPTKDIGTPYFR